MSYYLEAFRRGIHYILSGDSVEMDVKETSCDCCLWEVIVEVHNLPRRSCADFHDVRSLNGDERVREKARWSRQHLCRNLLNCDVEPRFCFGDCNPRPTAEIAAIGITGGV